MGVEYGFAQNCGIVDSVVFDIVDNGNGTSDYSFTSYYSTTSGGSKSVSYFIYCGTDTMVNSGCLITSTSQLTASYGPFTRPTCGSSILVTWAGYTNSTCGGSSCLGDTGVSAVPVTYISSQFDCEKNQLVWSTASEVNNEGFEVQRLVNGDWTYVGWVSGAGNSSMPITYRYTLPFQAGMEDFLRLKQIDYDRKFEYSRIVAVNCSNDEQSFYPNPAKQQIHFTSRQDVAEIVSTDGKILVARNNVEDLDVSELDPGYYFVRIRRGYVIRTESLVIQ